MFLLSCGCKCSVSLPRVPWVGLWAVVLGFPCHTHMLSFKAVSLLYSGLQDFCMEINVLNNFEKRTPKNHSSGAW